MKLDLFEPDDAPVEGHGPDLLDIQIAGGRRRRGQAEREAEQSSEDNWENTH